MLKKAAADGALPPFIAGVNAALMLELSQR